MAASDASSESGLFNMETKLQYESHEPLPFIIENEMSDLTVDELKRYLLSLALLHYVKEQPQELKMYLFLPGTQLGQGDHLVEMEGHRKMREFREELGRCRMVKLLKAPHGDTPLNLGYIKHKQGGQ